MKAINPWTVINLNNRVCQCDKEFLNRNNKSKKGKPLLSTVEMPEPFIGSANSEIFILMGSPGLDSKTSNYTNIEEKLLEENKPENLRIIIPFILENLNDPFYSSEYPFFSINPSLKESKSTKDKKHFEWWNRVFKNIHKDVLKIEKSSDEIITKAISKTFFNIELYGYHSVKTEHKFLNKKNRLPSVDFSIQLVKKAMQDSKMILIPRAVNTWFRLIDGLSDYENCHFIATNRSIEISRTTLSPKPYNDLIKIIRQKVVVEKN